MKARPRHRRLRRGLWQQYAKDLSWQEEQGRRLRLARQRQGLTYRQVARITARFGAGWAVGHKTVATLENGGAVAHASRGSVKRALGLRGEFEVYEAVELDFDELMTVDSDLDPS